jgi:anti-sigma factor RsiW
MQHAEFRRQFGADPRRAEPEVLEHRRACAECARYADDLEKIDRLVAGALDEPAPAAPPPWELEARRSAVRRWMTPTPRKFALAATVLLTLFVALVWTATSRDRAKLIADIVKHAGKESSVFVASTKRVENPKIEAALKKAGAELIAELPVSIARICKVRGNVAPHLIVQTHDGAVHVMILSEERFWRSHSFTLDGYQGRLVPQGKHAFAVIGTSEAAVEEAAELAKKGIDWKK